MGLDMYLYKRTYVKNWDHMKPEKRHEITVTLNGAPVDHIKPERISYIIEQVAYWRKANQIHAWFVQNVQDGKDDCQESSLERDKLEELLDVVNRVLADPSLAKDLLPTESGFFFGSTEYDEEYITDLEDTKAQLTPLLAESEEVADYYYHASW